MSPAYPFLVTVRTVEVAVYRIMAASKEHAKSIMDEGGANADHVEGLHSEWLVEEVVPEGSTP